MNDDLNVSTHNIKIQYISMCFNAQQQLRFAINKEICILFIVKIHDLVCSSYKMTQNAASREITTSSKIRCTAPICFQGLWEVGGG